MKESDILTLAKSGNFHGQPLSGQIEETHISWVILTRKYAFKLKKPLKLSFLDFSKLSGRKKFCEQELMLNRRFSKIYKSVLPVRYDRGTWYMGGKKGRVVDYAVQMKRMISSKRMDLLLRTGKVTRENIFALAEEIGSFHSRARIITRAFDIVVARRTFNDIRTIRLNILRHLGSRYSDFIDRSVRWSDSFLKAHKARIQERIRMGFLRDVHGDLHSGNIFLYKHPVLFDCIEFADSLRFIDVIAEIAFFCMDLDYYGYEQLAEIFLSEYNRCFPCILNREDERLLLYYECYRANVKAKVHMSSAEQALTRIDYSRHMQAVRGYLNLMKRYMNKVQDIVN